MINRRHGLGWSSAGVLGRATPKVTVELPESDLIHTFQVQIHGVTLTSSTGSKKERAKRLAAQQALDILAQDSKSLRKMCNCEA
ncbi:hypothetical protein BGZ49_004238 [Haplosporangium sp. Z 27]|nr:hypothetical protein BGZ49_004238 [Haplosporangium sp. Z 27]